MLLKAGWDKHVHEIWVAITPEKEVCGHLHGRGPSKNTLSEFSIVTAGNQTELPHELLYG